MRKMAPLIVLAFAGSSAALVAETPIASASAENPAKEKKICRTTGVKTDTRIGGAVRQCKTAAEWSRTASAGEEGRVRSSEADTIRRTRVN